MAVSEWISVKKYLPGLDINWCIVLTKNIDNLTFAFMASYNYHEESWEYLDSDQNYSSTMKVTHWMPLPSITIESPT